MGVEQGGGPHVVPGRGAVAVPGQGPGPDLDTGQNGQCSGPTHHNGTNITDMVTITITLYLSNILVGSRFEGDKPHNKDPSFE